MKRLLFLTLVLGIIFGWFLRGVVEISGNAANATKDPKQAVNDELLNHNQNILTDKTPGKNTVKRDKKTNESAISRIQERKLDKPEDWPSYQLWLEHFDKLQPHTDKHYWLQAHAAKLLTKDYQRVFEALLKAMEYASDNESLQKSRLLLDEAITDYKRQGKTQDGMRRYQQTLEFFHEKSPSHALGNLALAELMAFQGELDLAFSYLEQIEPFSKHQEKVQATRHKLEAKSLSLDSSEIKIPLSRLRNQFVVEAFFNSIPLRLLLDTGASSTVLDRDSANDLLRALPEHFRYSGKTTQVSTANGLATSRIFHLKQLRVGPYSLENLRILDVPMGSTEHFDGLLGMDFLGRYNFKIDRVNALLVFDENSTSIMQ